MTMLRATLALCQSMLCLALLLASPVQAGTVCSADADPGTGGTGRHADIGSGGTGIGTGGTGIGTGGTGIGTGGTGMVGDIGTGGTGRTVSDPGTGGTGIVGVITGFASVCVNGIEAEFDARTVITDNGKPAGPGSLKIGQVVHVQAAGQGERVFARRIDVSDVLVGPVTRVDPRTRRLEVMNQPVRWDASRAMPGAAAPNDVRPGQYVRVSGFRAPGGEVLASRVDHAPPGQVRLTGEVTAARGRELQVQGIRVEAATAQTAPRDALVRVEGRWQGDSIVAERIAPATMSFGRDVGFVSVQGIVDAAGVELRVGDLRLSPGTSGSDASLQAGEFVQVEARVGRGGKLEIEEVLRGDKIARPRGGRGSDDSRQDDDAGDEVGAANSGKNDRDDRDDDSADREAEGRSESSPSSSHGGREERDRDDRDSSQGRGGDPEGADTRLRTERSRERDDAAGSERREGREAREAEDRLERVEKREKVERVERVERVDRIERVERVERVDRIDRVERIDRIDRELRPERIDRVKREDRSGRDH